MFLSLFNSFAYSKYPPDIVCLQEPPFWRFRLPSFQNYTSFAPPGGTGNKPKVACYVSTYLLAQATVLPAFFDRPDVVALDAFGVDLFGRSISHFRILNLYNLRTKRTSQMTVSPLVAYPEPFYSTLVVGDFIIHNPLPDPLCSHSADQLATSFPSFSRSSELGFGLLNQPGVNTRLPPSPHLARTMSLFKLYFHIHLLLSLRVLHLPIRPESTGLLLSNYSETSPFISLLLSPLGYPFKPGSTDTSPASPPSLPPTPQPNALPTTRSPGGPPCFPSLHRNSTLPQGGPSPPTSLPIEQPPTSPRRATSTPSKPPRRLTRDPS